MLAARDAGAGHRLLLFALPRSCIPSARAPSLTPTPRVQLTWPPSDAPPGELRLLQSATCGMREGTPILHVAHLLLDAACGAAHVRSAVVDLVDVGDADDSGGGGGGGGGAARVLGVHAAPPQPLAAASEELLELRVRPPPPF